MDFSLPRLSMPSLIGNGVNYVSKFLTSKLNSSPGSSQSLVDYLLSLNHQGEKLMINETLNTVSKLQAALLVAEATMSVLPKDTPYQSFGMRFKEWGFEKGWGDNAERVLNMTHSLSEILQAPDPLSMERFFGKLPLIFKVVLFSVHGYFGQSDVLVLPDTGGQVVYVLNQVDSLEEELLQSIKQQGLSVKPQILVVTRLIPDAKGTKCNVEFEPRRSILHDFDALCLCSVVLWVLHVLSTRGRHHCRFCGGIFSWACSKGRCLLPAKFRERNPHRVCDTCYVRLDPLQGVLINTISNSAQVAKHDVMDWTSSRAWLNLPVGMSMEYEIYKSSNMLRSYYQV